MCIRDSLNSYAKTIDKVIELYGIQPYNSQFSSLQLVGQDDESYYFYHDDFKTVYQFNGQNYRIATVSYTHLRAHETGRNLVCRLLLEKKKHQSLIPI